MIDSGAIGEPLGTTAFMLGHGHESWHPDPEFYYKTGGGPMFDMGPYYLTALTTLLGPIRRLTGSARVSFPERTVGSGAKQGQKITRGHPDSHRGSFGLCERSHRHAGDVVRRVGGERAAHRDLRHRGVAGACPTRTTFGGPVRLWQRDTREWRDVPVTRPYAENSRGIGVADMAYAVRSGRPHRASGALGYHVLEAMHGFHDASQQDGHYKMTSTVERPAPLPADLTPGTLDE